MHIYYKIRFNLLTFLNLRDIIGMRKRLDIIAKSVFYTLTIIYSYLDRKMNFRSKCIRVFVCVCLCIFVCFFGVEKRNLKRR